MNGEDHSTAGPLERMAAVIEHAKRHNLGAYDSRTLLCVAYRDGGEGAYASTKTMAEETGIHRRNLARSLGRLVELGCIRRGKARQIPSGQWTASYHFERCIPRDTPIAKGASPESQRCIPRDTKGASPKMHKQDLNKTEPKTRAPAREGRAEIEWLKVVSVAKGAPQSSIADQRVHDIIEGLGGWLNLRMGRAADLRHVKRQFIAAYRAAA